MELVTIIEKGGPMVLTAVLAFLFWTERSERRELQTQINEMLKQSITAMESTKNALAALTAILTNSGRPTP